jgi:hypothetical protein
MPSAPRSRWPATRTASRTNTICWVALRRMQIKFALRNLNWILHNKIHTFWVVCASCQHGKIHVRALPWMCIVEVTIWVCGPSSLKAEEFSRSIVGTLRISLSPYIPAIYPSSY